MAVSDGIEVGVEETMVRMVFGACKRVGCWVADEMIDVAGLIVVDAINRGPCAFVLCTTEAFVTVTIFVADDARFEDATFPSLLIEKTM